MKTNPSDYGTSILNAIEETNQRTAEVNFVFAMGAKLGKDGKEWSCLLGANPMEGHETFDPSPYWAVEKMRVYILHGDKINKQEGKNEN